MDGTEHTLKTVKDHTKSNEDAAATQFQFDGIGQLLKVTDPAGKFTSYTYDMAGRKLSVTHPSTGTTSFTYDNLGNVLTKKTGLYYYGARYLDPTGAMWLGIDPLWEKYAGMNPYNYCAGNPVMLVDVDGRSGREANLGGPCKELLMVKQKCFSQMSA